MEHNNLDGLPAETDSEHHESIDPQWANRHEYLEYLMKKVRLQYSYFRPDRKTNSYHDGIVCVGWVWDEITKQIKYSAAFCSPVDSFCREEGRWYIINRFLKYFWVVVDCDCRPTRGEAAMLIKDHYHEQSRDIKRLGLSLGLKGPIPRWAKTIPDITYTGNQNKSNGFRMENK